MRVILLDVDSKIPNLALMKLSAWYKIHGFEVFLHHMSKYTLPITQKADIIFASCLYTKNASSIPKDIIKGGVGVNPEISLPLEIEKIKPDYSLYPDIDYSLGYTYRHCPRRCPWCIVWKMGVNKDKKHHSIWEFHDPKFKKIILLDNNLFADVEWRETFEEVWKADLKMDMTQGFDIRLLNEEKAEALARTKFVKQIHFAFDLPEHEDIVRSGVALLKKVGIKLDKITFYVLCGFNTTSQQDINRVQILRELGVLPFVMKYHSKSIGLNRFTRLASRPAATKMINWSEYKNW